MLGSLTDVWRERAEKDLPQVVRSLSPTLASLSNTDGCMVRLNNPSARLEFLADECTLGYAQRGVAETHLPELMRYFFPVMGILANADGIVAC